MCVFISDLIQQWIATSQIKQTSCCTNLSPNFPNTDQGWLSAGVNAVTVKILEEDYGFIMSAFFPSITGRRDVTLNTFLYSLKDCALLKDYHWRLFLCNNSFAAMTWLIKTQIYIFSSVIYTKCNTLLNEAQERKDKNEAKWADDVLHASGASPLSDLFDFIGVTSKTKEWELTVSCLTLKRGKRE